MRRALHDVTTSRGRGAHPGTAPPSAHSVNEARLVDAPADPTFRVGNAGSTARAVGVGPVVMATGLPARLRVDMATRGTGVDTDATGTLGVTGQEGASVTGPVAGRMVEDAASSAMYAAAAP